MENLSTLFQMFKLDDRASQTELEIAYTTLTSDPLIPKSVRTSYRNAFETLMLKWFGVGNECTELSEAVKEVKEEQEVKDWYTYIPSDIQCAINELENCVHTKFEDSMKKVLALQSVNLPLFYWAIKRFKRVNLWGKKFWTEDDMLNIFNKCQLNQIDFRNLTFTIYVEKYFNSSELKKFVHNQQKLFLGYGEMCPRFDVLDSKQGCQCAVTISNDLGQRLLNILQGYVAQNDLYFCASGDVDLDKNDQ